jgi:peroxiredoxin
MTAISRRALAIGALASAAAPALAQPAQERRPLPGDPDDPRPRVYALIDQPAPDFAFPLRGGGAARLSDYRGRTLVLYFGGLWCPDCVIDGPNTQALARLIARDRRLAFLQIHTRDRFGRWGSMDAYFSEYGYNWPVAFDASREFSRDVYRIEWSPSFLIIDRNGVIRRWRTDLTADGVRAFFREAQTVARA